MLTKNAHFAVYVILPIFCYKLPIIYIYIYIYIFRGKHLQVRCWDPSCEIPLLYHNNSLAEGHCHTLGDLVPGPGGLRWPNGSQNASGSSF